MNSMEVTKMMNELYKELAHLQTKLTCSKILFGIISVLLSIVVVPILFICFACMTIVLIVLSSGYCIILPFLVLYQCIKNKCVFILED